MSTIVGPNNRPITTEPAEAPKALSGEEIFEQAEKDAAPLAEQGIALREKVNPETGENYKPALELVIAKFQERLSQLEAEKGE